MKERATQSESPLHRDPLQLPLQEADLASRARRRLLLKGASGTVAAAAALQPIGALAQTSTRLVCKNGSGKDALCTVSGVSSAAHSFGPGITRVQAWGKDCSWWAAGLTKTSGTATNVWPTGLPKACTPATLVGNVLPGCNSTYLTKAVRWLLCNDNTTKGSIEADFICAYLSAGALWASTPSASKPFPYSPQEVLDLWLKGTDSSKRLAAQALFNGIKKA